MLTKDSGPKADANTRKLKIALGDLKHDVAGRHLVNMPIGIGYIASYVLAHMDPGSIEIRLYDDPDIIFEDINSWKPDVIGLSNYCWNTGLSCLTFRYAKKLSPNVVCVAGGPEFPTEQRECLEYLLERREIDFYAYQEGETAFAELIEKLRGEIKLNDLKSEPQGGIVSINPKTNDLIVGKPIPRIADLDRIPSPYLGGLMNQWFNGFYVPSVVIARGCPFSCGYCKAAESWYSPLTRFSLGRTEGELNYIFQKMKLCPNVSVSLLSLCDSDFGMTEHDERVARLLGGLQEKFNWPDAFEIITGKTNYSRILRIASLLRNKMVICASVQSLNPKTLEIIKRENLPLEQYRELFGEIKKRGMSALSEFILPLPEETKDSFLKSIKTLMDTGANNIQIFTTMLLKGTPIASREYRKKHGMNSKFRLVSRQFGEYQGEKCLEIEEICVATGTLSFEDYLECRGFSLVLSLLANEQFDVINRHLEELKVNTYNFLVCIWELIKSGKTGLSQIYADFIKETREELWDSKESIYEYFSKPENYKKLLSGKLGDNLLRKYKTRMLLRGSCSAIKLAYSVIKEILGDNLSPEINDSLDAAKKWAVAGRNIGSAVRNKSFRRKIKRVRLPYDVNGWYLSGAGLGPLTSYKRSVAYKMVYDAEGIETILANGERFYGKDSTFIIGKFLVNFSIKRFWGKSESLD